ncbi:hypothetical protein A3D72_00120 [Candidatus Uhrbacteria bacterium RIFCSPHIGHO2_02_FULL_57_19]|uniref:Uncharacterized protein n=1 Tax=Candidatus Uhrbacteria bacterium RIFCSPHIGHO2_02_FULL_57_19 TaxID=1802391 RepID=A0A1F7U5S3_9BACT|nr:MAG: hypothetical protein A3D72_00120 [Candidatus Uhrbacteria bacterium RIFCSPHIGHO2_02_FULL_57_19]
MTLSKRDKTMLVVLLAVAIGIILVLTIGRSLLRGGAAPEAPKPAVVPTLDTAIFSDPRFQGLIAPRGLPVQAGKVGNSNPFVVPETKRAATTTVR